MGTDEPIRYGDSLSFLLSQVGAHSADLFADRLEPHGVTPRQFAVLSHLAHAGPRSQQQLADLLGIHRNNMVDLIDKMEQAGLVERVRDQADRRAFEIHPTTMGSAAVAAVNAVVPGLDDQLAGHLTAEERNALVEQLRSIADRLGLNAAVHPSVAGRRRA